MPLIKSRFDEYDDEGVLDAYIRRHYMYAFISREGCDFMKSARTPEEQERSQMIRDRAVQRIKENHLDDIIINRCPECNCILETPKARLCLWCGHTFFDVPRPPSQVRVRFETEMVDTSDDDEIPYDKVVSRIRARHEWIGGDITDAASPDEPESSDDEASDR